MNRPFFLIGSERSGSTMLRLMLDHHPQLACNLESDFLVSQLGEQGQYPAMSDFHAFLRQDRVFRHSRFEIDERLDYTAVLVGHMGHWSCPACGLERPQPTIRATEVVLDASQCKGHVDGHGDRIRRAYAVRLRRLGIDGTASPPPDAVG